MKPAYKALIQKALRLGFSVSVWDGEEWQVKRSHSIRAIDDAIKSVDMAKLRFRNPAGEIVGTALVAAYGFEPDETVIDDSQSPWMTEPEPPIRPFIGQQPLTLD
jgi:hypothetical protein